jgi:hypothetical protein
MGAQATERMCMAPLQALGIYSVDVQAAVTGCRDSELAPWAESRGAGCGEN